MKDKEKQIEEMFQDVAKVMCDCEDKEKFFRPHRYGCRNCYMHTVIQHIVFFLRNSDYQKIDKDSVVETPTIQSYSTHDNDLVVLTKEEAERFRGQTVNIAKIKAQASKETAEKILKWLKDHCAFAGWVFVEAYFREQFGVEIKE